jgi:hypothetical protein
VGFIDRAGVFSIVITKRVPETRVCFHISQKDETVLNRIKKAFKGRTGKRTKTLEEKLLFFKYNYMFNTLISAQNLQDYLTKYPLLTCKHLDYLI